MPGIETKKRRKDQFGTWSLSCFQQQSNGLKSRPHIPLLSQPLKYKIQRYIEEEDPALPLCCALKIRESANGKENWISGFQPHITFTALKTQSCKRIENIEQICIIYIVDIQHKISLFSVKFIICMPYCQRKFIIKKKTLKNMIHHL